MISTYPDGEIYIRSGRYELNYLLDTPDDVELGEHDPEEGYRAIGSFSLDSLAELVTAALALRKEDDQ